MQIDRSKVKLGGFSYRGLAPSTRVTVPEASTDLARLLPVAIRSFPAPEGFSAALFEKANLAMDIHPLKSDVVGDVGNVSLGTDGIDCHCFTGGMCECGQPCACGV
jgi:hypothetical protein